MPTEIKTRDTFKDIKVIDKVSSSMAHTKNVFVETKDRAEQTQESRHISPSEYANYNLLSSTKYTAQKAANCLKSPHKKIKENLNKAEKHFQNVKRKLPKQRKQAAKQAKTTAKNAQKTADVLKTKAEDAYKTAQESKKAVENAKRTLQQTRKAGHKTLEVTKKSIKSSKQIERGIKTSAKTAKTTAKGTIKTVKRSVKTAEKTAKTAVKTAKHTAKVAQQTAKMTAKSAKAAAHAAKVTAKAAIAATKATVKVTTAIVKATIAAIKGIIALISAGGWVAVLIIVIICVVAVIVGSVFGIFFSGEDAGTGRSMPDVVTELTMEFYDKAEDIKNNNPHDVLEMEAMSINWSEMLAVYAVKVNTDSKNPTEVVTIDNSKVKKLRSVLNDMVNLSHSLKTTNEEQKVTNKDGKESIETVEIITLIVKLEHKNADDMAKEYGFDKKQKEQLNELLSPQYDDLWAALFGGYSGGNDEILTPDSSFIPKDIFSWPFTKKYPITSEFGYRSDPFTGTTSFHNGVDIAASKDIPVLAAADGIVVSANSTDSWSGGWGYFVQLSHEGGYATFYAHCSRIAVRKGQKVKKGQVIAYVGTTGRSTGNHLHFEIWKDGVKKNPMGYFG